MNKTKLFRALQLVVVDIQQLLEAIEEIRFFLALGKVRTQ